MECSQAFPVVFCSLMQTDEQKRGFLRVSFVSVGRDIKLLVLGDLGSAFSRPTIICGKPLRGNKSKNQTTIVPQISHLSRRVPVNKSICNASKSSSGLGIRLLEERLASRSPTNSRFILDSCLCIGKRTNISNRVQPIHSFTLKL